MLKTFKVKAFKSLEEAEIELGRVNVFIGANGSGKSNLLEAIGILGAAANGRVDTEALIRRGVRPGLPSLYKSSFKGRRQPHNIEFSGASDTAEFKVGLFNPMDAPTPAWQFKTESLWENGQHLVGRSPATKRKKLLRLEPTAGYTALKAVEFPQESPAGKLLDALRQYAIYSPDTATLRGLVPDPQTTAPVGLSGGRLAEAVGEVLRLPWSENDDVLEDTLALIDWAEDFVSTSPRTASNNLNSPKRVLNFRDRFMAEERNVLSGYDASEGALYVLFMMVLAHHPEAPSVLAVDNFDHALNPRLAKSLTRLLCKWITSYENRQILLTSHNPLVLDGLPLRDDSVRLFTVERSYQGQTIVQRVTVSEELIQKAEEGYPLSQQWVMGTFGGVPNL